MNKNDLKNIYFIDQGIDDYESIVKALPTDAEFYILTTETVALEQIAAVLQGRTEIDSVSIISHGAEGQLTLAGDTLTKKDLEENAEILARIGTSLSDSGDILLYGCNVGAGEAGTAFLNTLAKHTGADIAASDDLTGAEELGGDWHLEVRTSVIETNVNSFNRYEGVLASTFTKFTDSTVPKDPFTTATAVTGNDRSLYTVAIDYDSDGDLDIISDDGAQYDFFINNGAGSFTEANYNLGFAYGSTKADDFIIADFDNDGDDDILQTDGAGAATYYKNNGDATFTVSPDPLAAATAITAGTSSLTTIAIDYDQDGDLDFIADDGAQYDFFINDGHGSFTEADYSPGFSYVSQAKDFLVEDFDSDGDKDILLADRDGTPTYYKNNGDTTFTAVTDGTDPLSAAGATTGNPGSLYTMAIDYDSDGDIDFISDKDGQYYFFRNNGAGSFEATGGALDFHFSVVKEDLLVADFDNDGDDDILVTDDDGVASYYRQDGTAPGTNNKPPVISSTSPIDNATDIGVLDNIVLTFDETISSAGAGTIKIYKASDDSLIETIPGNDSRVTGAGTTTITINPTATLGTATEYYILIDKKAFFDADGMTFMGVTDKTALSFTTESPNTNPSLVIDDLAYTEDNTTQVDSSVTANDSDGDADWDTNAKLEVQITADNEAGDQLSIGTIGGITLSGSNVQYNDGGGAVTIGTIAETSGIANDGTVTNGDKLTINFSNAATNAGVQALVQAIQYSTTSDNPTVTNTTRTVTFTLTDKNGGSASDTSTITITPVNDAPVINNLNGDSVTVSPNSSAYIDSSPLAAITDDSTNFDGGYLLIALTSGTADGSFETDVSDNKIKFGTTKESADGSPAGGDSVWFTSGELTTAIGTVDNTKTGQNGADLRIDFNSNATPSVVVLGFLSYLKYGSSTEGDRAFSVTVDDGDGGTSVPMSVTVSVVDNVAPTVLSIDRQTPGDATTNADSLTWRVTFSEAVTGIDAADFSVSGTTGTVTDVSSAGGNAYDVTVSGGNLASYEGAVTLSFAGGQNITDSANTPNALTDTTPSGTNNADYTLENTAPTLNGAGSTPADNALVTDLATDLLLKFSENIALGSGNIVLKDLTNNSTVETFNAATGLGDAGGAISVATDTLTINPNADLSKGTQYAVQIVGTAITDVAGNAFAGISDDTSYNISTQPLVELSVDSNSITEAGGVATYTLSLKDAAGNAYNAPGDVTVTMSLSGTATGGGTDYSLGGNISGNDVTISSGSSSQTFTVTGVDDNPTTDDAETVIVDIASVANGFESGTQQRTVTLSEKQPPVISNLDGDSATFQVGTTTRFKIDTDTVATVTDGDHANFDSGWLSIENYTSDLDQALGNFSVDGTVVQSGGDTALASGDSVTVNGTAIGVVENINDGQGGDDLRISFNSSAIPTLVSTLLQNLYYLEDTTATELGDRTYQVTITDSSGGTTSSVATVTFSGVMPVLTSAAYNADTGALVVTGTDIPDNGSGDDIDASLLTLTGEGGETYQLTDTADVERTSATEFTLNLSATDQAALNLILNKNSTASTDNTSFNIAGADNWAMGAIDAVNIADETGNAVTVSNVPAPTITSATYNGKTGTLVVTGTGFLKKAGAGNDIDLTKLTLTGEAGGTRVLTTGNVEISSGTEFTVVLNAADKTAVDALLNKNGTQSAISGTTYNLRAAEDWAAGADAAVDVADLSSNGITVTLNAAPTSADTTESVSYNGSYTFETGDFAFTDSDTDDSLDHVSILSLPDKGTLKLNGNDINLNPDVDISAADISAGKLVYTPDSGGTGSGYSSFQFSVNDGTTDSGSQTVTLDVGAPPPPPAPEPESEKIDGAVVNTVDREDADGNAIQVIQIDPISSQRQDSDDTSNQADVPLHFADDSGQDVVTTVSLPTGIGIEARANDTAHTRNGLADLIYLINETAGDTEPSRNDMVDSGQRFLEGLRETDDSLWVNQVTLTSDSNSGPAEPIKVTGSAADDQNNYQEALVIDTRQLPAGSQLELADIEFAVIVGDGLVIRGGEGANTVFTGEGSQDIVLGEDDDELHGGNGNDTVGSKGGDDLLFGENGNDILFGGAGNDTLHGGADIDVATYDGNLAEYDVVQTNGVITITNKADGSDSDTLVNIEQVQFSDGNYLAHYDTELKALATLYQNVLGRQADLTGFQWWAEQLDNGASFGDTILGFMQSGEYLRQLEKPFMELNHQVQLDVLYQAVLGREADDKGKNDWLIAMDAGMNILEVAHGFAVSPELLGQLQLSTQWDFTL